MKKTVEVFQFSPFYQNLDENQNYLIRKIEDSINDILVFPELSLSGYFFISSESIDGYSIETSDHFFKKIQTLSKETNKIICFGFAERDDNNYYNSAAIFFPDEDLSSVYRKSHLFYKESLVFEKGNTGFFTINYPQWDINIGLMICYDWRFPEAARTLALQGADIILCPSNLVTGVWQKVMEARALENKVYMVVANRVGSETFENETLTFNGESSIISCNGNIMVKAGIDNEISIISEIDPKKTRDKSFNSINNIFNDRREEIYFKNSD